MESHPPLTPPLVQVRAVQWVRVVVSSGMQYNIWRALVPKVDGPGGADIGTFVLPDDVPWADSVTQVRSLNETMFEVIFVYPTPTPRFSDPDQVTLDDFAL